jgi:hypothetical protein
MFYKGGDKRKRLVLCGVVCLLTVIWAVQVYSVNASFPGKTIIECRYNESIGYAPDVDGIINADVSLTPVSCVMLTADEVSKNYPELFENMGSFVSDYLIFEVNIKNNRNEEVRIYPLTAFFLYASPFNGDSNSLTYIDTDNVSTVGGNEELTIKLAASVISDDSFGKGRDRYINTEQYILVSQYPEERRLVFRIEKSDVL